MNKLLAVISLVSIATTAFGQADVETIKASAQCKVQLLQDSDEMSRNFNVDLQANSKIPVDYDLTDILNNRYKIKKSKILNESSTVALDFSYAPVNPIYSGSNKSNIQISISNQNDTSCDETYFFNVTVGNGNNIDFTHKLPKTCQKWAYAWIQCNVYASDSETK